MKGFIKLPREISEWEWYQDPVAFRLFTHLILRANYTTKKWQGTLVQRGQLTTSTDHLAHDLNLSIQQIRTGIKKLKSSGYITVKTTNKFTLITVIDYEKMQGNHTSANKQNNTLATNQTQTDNKQITTTKEGKNNKEKNKVTIEERKQIFKNDVFKYSQYSNEILLAFFNFWSEIDSKSNKMKFEKQTAFEILVRLEKWLANEFRFKNNVNTQKNISTNR
jgi:biotin operon repressor